MSMRAYLYATLHFYRRLWSVSLIDYIIMVVIAGFFVFILDGVIDFDFEIVF